MAVLSVIISPIL